jgi:tagatose 6-phosphate kinase
MILCITPNPAVDRTARVSRLVVGQILRPLEVLALPGGKGMNVARAARTLGAEVRTTGVVGGHSGEWIVEEAAREGLNPRFVTSGRESRTTYVVSGDDGRSVLVYEKGLDQPQASFDELISLLRSELLRGCSYAVVAGGLPSGVDPRYLGRIVAACNEAGVRCIVDSHGPAVLAALAEKPFILKATQEEMAESGFGTPRGNPLAMARAAVKQGAEACIVTIGPRGAVACFGVGAGRAQGALQESYRLTVPLQVAVNAVGAGDAFTAGLVVALAGSRRVDEALVQAGAAGAASVLQLGAGILDPAKVREVTRLVVVRRAA